MYPGPTDITERKRNWISLTYCWNNSFLFFACLKAIAKLTASYIKKHLPAMHKTHTSLSDAQAEIEYLKVSRLMRVSLPLIRLFKKRSREIDWWKVEVYALRKVLRYLVPLWVVFTAGTYLGDHCRFVEVKIEGKLWNINWNKVARLGFQ